MHTDKNLQSIDFTINSKQLPKQLETLLDDNRAAIKSLLQQTVYTWDNFIQPLDNLNDKLNQFWSPVSHLNSVMNSDELRVAYNECLPLLSDYSTYLGQHQGLFDAYQQIKQSTAYDDFNQAQKAAIDYALRDFTLSGVALDDEAKGRYKAIATKLSELTTKFEENIIDANKAWFKHINNAHDLKGLPEQRIAAAKEAAASKKLDGYVLTLDIPCYMDVMTFADSQTLRKEFYDTYCTRASDKGPNASEFDNSELMQDILALRDEKAKLLNFKRYSDYSLAAKMADSPEVVQTFLSDLVSNVTPHAKADLTQLQEEYGELEPWDIPYYSEKYRQKHYAISQEEVRPYFPCDTVINGLFVVLKKLFGIHFIAETVPTWHKDVRYYTLRDNQDNLIGAIYMDLFARENKRGGAWMDEAICRRKLDDDSVQLPIAYLTCNFAAPTKECPALLTHNDVVTLFHEMGHCLQHLLTNIDVSDVSGINNVAWDAVEFPSQFLEAWCWQEKSLSLLSGHYQTGDALPANMIEKLIKAKNFQSGLHLIRQLEFASFDMYLHSHFENTKDFTQAVLDKIRKEISVIMPPAYNRFAHAFSHIFAGGYAAGYYSYLWAEVLARDAFDKFSGNHLFDSERGRLFKDTVLGLGGSETPSKVFELFMKRKPNPQALLGYYGLN